MKGMKRGENMKLRATFSVELIDEVSDDVQGDIMSVEENRKFIEELFIDSMVSDRATVKVNDLKIEKIT